jgi:ATP-dependent helicase/nuclease subunit B
MSLQAFVLRDESWVEWLRGRIGHHKGDDPLAPVTVVTPNSYVGLAWRHELSRTGVINVRTFVLGRLAETVGAPQLATTRKRPLTTASEYAVIRRALEEVRPRAFEPVRGSPKLIDALRRLFLALRAYRLDEDTSLDELGWGPSPIAATEGPRYGGTATEGPRYGGTATEGPRYGGTATEGPRYGGVATEGLRYGGGEVLAAAIDVFRRWRALMQEHGRYDSVDLLEAAATAAREGSSVLELDLGAIVVANPRILTPADIQLLKALATRVPVDVAWREFGDEADALILAQAEALGADVGGGGVVGGGGGGGGGPLLRGPALDGSALHGSALDGSALDGSALHGSALDGSALQGAALQGDLQGDLRGDLQEYRPEATMGTAVHPSPGRRHIVSAPDAAEEVRTAVRGVLRDLEEHGTSMYRIAVLYRNEGTYAQMLRDVLASAHIPFAGLERRALADSYAGRTLLGLLKLVESDFGRAEVMQWMSALTRDIPGWPVPGRWERITRATGIVRGIEQWRTRLDLHASELRFQLDKGEKAAGEGKRAVLAREIKDTEQIRRAMDGLYSDTRPPEVQSWTAHVAWLQALMERFVLEDKEWPDLQKEARQGIDEIISGLVDAAQIEARVDTATCIETLTQALASSRQPEGKLGRDVVVGPLSSASGMEFDRTYVLGVTEGAFPSAQPVDPLLPAEGDDPLQRQMVRTATERAAFLSVIGGTRYAVTVSFSSWDSQRRPVYPSRWLVEIARDLSQKPISAAQLREHPSDSWITTITSPMASTRDTTAPLSQGERRLQEALKWTASGVPLRATPLARREDLTLRQSLVVAEARASAQFTKYDGNVGDVSAEIPDLANGLDGTLTSATGVERWTSCGFRYFLDRVLHVAATKRPEQDDERWGMGADVRGSLVHVILEKFLCEMQSEGRLTSGERYSDADRERLHRIALEEFAALEGVGKTGHALVWQNERARLMLDLDTFLRVDEEVRGRGFVPTFLEQSFGFSEAEGSWPAVVVPFGEGRSVSFRGYIDRVDLSSQLSAGEAPVRAQVLDYKTGKPSEQSELDLDPVAAGTKLQLAIYANAVQQNMERLGRPLTSATASYWYISARGKFELVTVSASQAMQGRLHSVLGVIDEGIRAGAFLAVPGSETERPGRNSWDNCVYCEYDRVCPAAREVVYERKCGDGTARIRQSLQIGEGGPDESGPYVAALDESRNGPDKSGPYVAREGEG